MAKMTGLSIILQPNHIEPGSIKGKATIYTSVHESARNDPSPKFQGLLESVANWYSIAGLGLALHLANLSGSEVQTPLGSVEIIQCHADRYEQNIVAIHSGQSLLDLTSSCKYPHQVAYAIYNRNQQHFIQGNVHRLIEGANLVMPTQQKISQHSEQDAIDFIYAHSSFGTDYLLRDEEQ